MSSYSPSQDPGSRDRVRRLASSIPLGKRWVDVEAEVQRMSRLPQSDWIAEAEDLLNESLVHLSRKTHRVDEEVCGRLMQELSGRTVRIATRWARGFDETTTEEIVLKIEIKIIELVLAETPSPDSDFLELSFATIVKRLTLNAVRSYKRSPLYRRGQMPVADEDVEEFDDIERLIKLAADTRAGPEAVIAELEEAARRPELIRKACGAVKDPRHLVAVILHCVYGWPISSSDPEKWDLEVYFDVSPRQIKNWIAKALKTMCKAIGDEK